MREPEGVLAVEEDGSVLRARVTAGASDALLLSMLGPGFSVRRVGLLDGEAS